MKLKDLRVSWRQLLAEPAYSLVVVLGLAIAIAATYLIALLLNNRWLPDPAVPAPERVARMEFKGNIPGRNDDWFSISPFVFATALREAKAPITQAARLLDSEQSLRAGERLSKTQVLFSDADLAPMFGLKALKGDLQAALSKPDTIALSTAAAERLFGAGQEALGQRVRMNNQDMTVVAVLPRQAANSELQFDALASFDSPTSGMAVSGMDKIWFAVAGRVFVRLADGASTAQLTQLMQDIFDRSPGTKEVPPEWSAGGRKSAYVRAVPLSRLPFDGAESSTRLMLYAALGSAATMMLGLAAINYVNLSSVRTLRRQREIAVRKSLGASPTRLAAQFVAESSLVALLAGAVGLLLAWLLAPALADLLDVQFAAKLFAPTQLLSLLLGCLALGILTGLYPARVALGVHCAPALQGRKQSEGARGRTLRRAMTVFQFCAALTLSGAAVIVVWQSDYVGKLDLGFKTGGLLALDLPQDIKPEQVDGLYETLKSHPAVQGLSWSDDVPGRNPVGQIDTLANGSIKAGARSARYDLGFFSVYQIPLLAGSLEGIVLPDRTEPGVDRPLAIDETAVKAFGFASPQAAIGAQLKVGNDGWRVKAVVGAIKQESARNISQPQVFRLSKRVRSVLTLKGPDMAALRAAAAEAWPRYLPDTVIEMNGVEEQLAQRYRMDRNVGRLIAATSLIALLLAAFGVYALAAYTVRRSQLEIVIRKLHGADHRHIAGLLVKEFAPLLGLAAVFSLPLIWWIGQQYLAGFVERAPMGGWPLLAALMITLLMSGLAGLRHGLAAVSMRPILALRDGG